MAFYVWLALVLIFLVLELCTGEATMLWFAAGAVASFLLTLIPAPVWLQVLVFFVVSFALLAALRPIVRKKFLKCKDKRLTKLLLDKIGVVKKVLIPNVLFLTKFEKKLQVVVLNVPSPVNVGQKLKVISVLNGVVMAKVEAESAQPQADALAETKPSITADEGGDKNAISGLNNEEVELKSGPVLATNKAKKSNPKPSAKARKKQGENSKSKPNPSTRTRKMQSAKTKGSAKTSEVKRSKKQVNNG